jgi:hypothetical protein
MGSEPWLSHMMVLNYSDTVPQVVESKKLIEYCTIKGIFAERPFLKKEYTLCDMGS